MPDETIAVNRRAHHDYAIEDTIEAGLVLTGTEIKSIRAHKVNIAEAYARVEKGGVAHRRAHRRIRAGQPQQPPTDAHTEAAPPPRSDRRADRAPGREGIDHRAAAALHPSRPREAGARDRAWQEAARQAALNRRARHAARARARVEGVRPHQALGRPQSYRILTHRPLANPPGGRRHAHAHRRRPTVADGPPMHDRKASQLPIRQSGPPVQDR